MTQVTFFFQCELDVADSSEVVIEAKNMTLLVTLVTLFISLLKYVVGQMFAATFSTFRPLNKLYFFFDSSSLGFGL